MVTPPALIAATPVGATTIIRFGEVSLSFFQECGLSCSRFSGKEDVGSGIFQIVEGKVQL